MWFKYVYLDVKDVYRKMREQDGIFHAGNRDCFCELLAIMQMERDTKTRRREW
jgi:hypothetical protein